jgi:hypothetical protein
MMKPESVQQAVGARVLAAAQAELARRDVDTFCELVMRDPKGRPWRQAAFHSEWHRLFPEAGPSRNLIVAPRGSAKSSQLSVARALWELGRNPELRVKLICATDDLASKLLTEIARNITQNRRLRGVFPHLRPDPQGPWTRTQLRVIRTGLSKDPSIEAHGILSAGVGGRADLLVFDDVCDQRTAVLQPAMREQIKRVFYETWLPLLGPEGRAVYVATVWHLADLTVELRDSGHWTVWWRGARDELTGELLWPEVWSEEALRRTESEIGSRAFARQFLLQAVSDEERLFSADAIARCRDVRYAVGRLPAPQDWPVFAGVDLAASVRPTGSWSVIFVVAVSPQRQRLPVEILRFQERLAVVVDRIAEVCQRWQPGKIVVENNAFQEAVLDLLRRDDPELPLEGYRTGSEKADDQIGLPALAAAVDRGDWIIPAGGVPHGGGCACAYCAWQREMLLYPGGEHSDTVMGMWFAEIAARAAVPARQYHYPGPEDNDALTAPSRWRDLGGGPWDRWRGG